MLKIISAAIAITSAPVWAAQPPVPFTGSDYSGRYECSGKDSHSGSYKGTVDMKLNTEQSSGKYGAYSFTMILEDKSRYDGFAAATSDMLAIYFAHTDPALKDYGVGLAQLVPTAKGKVSFTKYYYGPEYEGGGHGMEYCVKG
jgi:hypothetical protein